MPLTQNCPKSQKSSLNLNESISLNVQGEKICICGSFKSAKNNWVHKSQIRKSQNNHGPQIGNLQIAKYVDGPQIK